MAEKTQLGLYWGKDAFGLVETAKGLPEKIAHVPFDSPLETGANQSSDMPEGLKYTALIQMALRQQKVSARKVSLSLPASDLIFRSFVIPFMQPSEVINVVDFEATKYIPIKLEDLSYTYHAVPLIENNQKSLRILFVAIRKNILQKYTGILEHTGLQLNHIEPAPVSLLRVLQSKSYILRNQASAVIYFGPTGGDIIIVDNDVVQFVREFQLPEDTSDPNALNSKILNDIRVSLNFYTRQNPQGKIDKIVLTSLTGHKDLPKALTDEFGVPVTSVSAARVLKLKTEEVEDLGPLNAYGIALRDKKFSSRNFDLSEKSTAQMRSGGSAGDMKSYKMVASIVGTCLLIISLSIFLGKQMVAGQKKRLVDLKSKEGIFRSSETTQVEQLHKDLKKKLLAYQDIRANSNIAFYLSKLPAKMPSGTWLNSLNISYYDKKIKEKKGDRIVSRISLTMDGYAYLRIPNEQIRLVNSLVSELKKEADFAKSFESIDLVTMKQDKLEQHSVTYFQIVCK